MRSPTGPTASSSLSQIIAVAIGGWMRLRLREVRWSPCVALIHIVIPGWPCISFLVPGRVLGDVFPDPGFGFLALAARSSDLEGSPAVDLDHRVKVIGVYGQGGEKPVDAAVGVPATKTSITATVIRATLVGWAFAASTP